MALTDATLDGMKSRLEGFAKTCDLWEDEDTQHQSQSKKRKRGHDSVQFETSVPEHHPSRTRASLLFYIDAILSRLPTIDDNVLFGYLNARFAGDNMEMFIDLIVSSFDLIAVVKRRIDHESQLRLCRSFLANKVPGLLHLISTSAMESFSTESCVERAMQRLDLATFPAQSSAFALSRDSPVLPDMRLDFLLACSLYSLIPESSIESLIGEQPLRSLPPHGLYQKQALLQQMTKDHRKIKTLILELANIEGNAGIIAHAIVEV